MSGLIFQTRVLKMKNNGSGTGFRREHQKHKLRDIIHPIAKEGETYLVFNCPGCGQRNKWGSRKAKYAGNNGMLAFPCKKCGNTVEVCPAPSLIQN